MNIGLYIHVPFCKSKCNYCSFFSIDDDNCINDYVNALQKEIETKVEKYAFLWNKYEKGTLYIGGGTPSILPVKALGEIFKSVRKVPLTLEEITIEANPESITEDKLKYYINLGINRISLGIQSFDDEILSFLGRKHTTKDSFNALNVVKKYFENFSIDIIGGIPGFNDIDNILKNIEDIKPPHISFYLLTKEKGSHWGKKINIKEKHQIYEYNQFSKFIKSIGYKHYEISNFALKGFECKHNEIYWQRGEYLGFGPSAVSFLRKGDDEKNDTRLKNISSISRYISDPFSQHMEFLDSKKALIETIFLALRTSNGLKKCVIKNDFPETYNVISEKCDYLCNRGLLIENEDGWSMADKHFIISNEIILWILRDL